LLSEEELRRNRPMGATEMKITVVGAVLVVGIVVVAAIVILALTTQPNPNPSDIETTTESGF